MKKSIVIVTACMVISNICFAQTNTSTALYNESIQIKADDGRIMANVDVNGKVTVAPQFNYDNVINILIIRMVNQNKQYSEQFQTINKIMEDVKFKANITSQKAEEIFQIWNPPKPVVETVKKEDPVTEVKKGFWSKFW